MFALLPHRHGFFAGPMVKRIGVVDQDHVSAGLQQIEAALEHFRQIVNVFDRFQRIDRIERLGGKIEIADVTLDRRKGEFDAFGVHRRDALFHSLMHGGKNIDADHLISLVKQADGESVPAEPASYVEDFLGVVSAKANNVLFDEPYKSALVRKISTIGLLAIAYLIGVVRPV